jgi:hypothetical protein
MRSSVKPLDTRSLRIPFHSSMDRRSSRSSVFAPAVARRRSFVFCGGRIKAPGKSRATLWTRRKPNRFVPPVLTIRGMRSRGDVRLRSTGADRPALRLPESPAHARSRADSPITPPGFHSCRSRRLHAPECQLMQGRSVAARRRCGRPSVEQRTSVLPAVRAVVALVVSAAAGALLRVLRRDEKRSRCIAGRTAPRTSASIEWNCCRGRRGAWEVGLSR